MNTVAFLPWTEIFEIENLADWDINVIYINKEQL